MEYMRVAVNYICAALSFWLARMVAWEPVPGPEGRLQKFWGKSNKRLPVRVETCNHLVFSKF